MKKHTKNVLTMVTALAVFFGSTFTPASERIPVGQATVFAQAAAAEDAGIPAETKDTAPAQASEIPAGSEEAALGDPESQSISSGQVDGGDGKVIYWTISDNNDNDVLIFRGEGVIPDYVASENNTPWGKAVDQRKDDDAYIYIPQTYVKKIVIGGGITRVGNGNFDNFMKVTEVELPETLAEIGDNAFSNCVALPAIEIPGRVKALGKSAFFACESLSQVSLPETLESIGDKGFYSTSLNSITLPSRLTSLGEEVFNNCKALKTVSFNKESPLEVLREFTFHNCDSLSSVELPGKLKTIEKHVFSQCKALKNIELPDTVETMGQVAFEGTGLERIEIPPKVSKLETYLFSGCGSLKRVAFGSNIVEMEYNAFSNCTASDKVILYSGSKEEFSRYKWDHQTSSGQFTLIYNYKKGVVNASAESGIGKAAITWDRYYEIDSSRDAVRYSIEKKKGPEEWEAVSENIGMDQNSAEITGLENGREYIFRVRAFADNNEVTAESRELSVIPSSVIKSGKIGENDNITWEICLGQEPGEFNLIISGNGVMPDYPDGVKTPWSEDYEYEGGYYKPKNLSRIIINDGITVIGSSNFKSLPGLTEVTLPESLETISQDAFASCEKLSSLTLNDGLETIGDRAFQLTALTDIDIPGSVKSIGEYAFAVCTSLYKLTLNDGLETIDTCAFQQCNIDEITIPASVKKIETDVGSPFNMCPKLVSINAAKGDSSFMSVDGVLFSRDGKRLIQYPAGKTGSAYTVPSGTEKIEPYAFAGCGSLKELFISEGLISVDSFAFAETNMDRVNIPDSVTELGLYLFSLCKADKVILPKNLDKEHLMPFLLNSIEVKDVYFPGSKEEWQTLEEKFEKRGRRLDTVKRA